MEIDPALFAPNTRHVLGLHVGQGFCGEPEETSSETSMNGMNSMNGLNGLNGTRAALLKMVLHAAPSVYSVSNVHGVHSVSNVHGVHSASSASSVSGELGASSVSQTIVTDGSWQMGQSPLVWESA